MNRGSLIEVLHIGKRGSSTFYSSHRAGKVDLLVMSSHVGACCVASLVTRAITTFRPDVLSIIGTAGALEADLEVGNILIADQVQALFDQETFYNRGELALPVGGIRLMRAGQMENHEFLVADRQLAFLAQEAAILQNIQTTRGNIGSADGFYSDRGTLSYLRLQGALAQDLESVAAATAAAMFGTPFFILKYVSTNAFLGKFGPSFLETGAIEGARILSRILQSMVTLMEKSYDR